MFTLEKEGFLSKDIDKWAKSNLKSYMHIFVLAYELNTFAQKLMFKMKVNSENVKQLLYATFYIRSLSSFQGTVILLEKGMMDEGKIILRNLLEILFSYMACYKNEDIAIQFILNSDKEKIATIRKIEKYKEQKKDKSDIPNFNEKLNDLLEIVNEYPKTKLTTEYLSQKAELYDTYLTAYHLLSQTAHARINDLDKQIRKDGQILFWGPNPIDLDLFLLTAIGAMIPIVKCTIEFFELDDIQEIERYDTICRALMNEKSTNQKK